MGQDTYRLLVHHAIDDNDNNGWDYEERIVGDLGPACDDQQDACRNRPGVPCLSAHSRSDHPPHGWMIADVFDALPPIPGATISGIGVQPFGSLERGDISGPVTFRVVVPGRLDREFTINFSGGCRWQPARAMLGWLDWTRNDVNQVQIWVRCPSSEPDVFITAIRITVDTQCIPISITQHPQSVTTCSGYPAQFCVAASGATGYQWFHNGALLPDQTNPCLAFGAVGAQHEGQYCCQVSNGCAPATTVCASLTVRPRPQSISRIDVNPNPACLGSTVTFDAVGGSGDRIAWYLNECDGQPIAFGPRITLQATPGLAVWARTETDFCDPDTASACVRSPSLDVVDPPLPPTTPSAVPSDVCAGIPAQVELRAVGGRGLVVWHEGSCTGPVVATGNPARINAPAATTSYYPNCRAIPCPDSPCAEPVTVRVHTAPTNPSAINADPAAICAGRDRTLTLTLVGGSGERAVWYANDCAGAFLGDGATLQLSPPPRRTSTFAARWESTSCPASACVFITIPVTATGADWNDDWIVDSRDFFDFLDDFFADRADFNADGAVTSQDFFDFLTAFFATC